MQICYLIVSRESGVGCGLVLCEVSSGHRLPWEGAVSKVIRSLVDLPLLALVDLEPRVRSLVWEDPTCLRVTQPLCRSAEPMLLNKRRLHSEKPQQGAAPLTTTREKASQQQRPARANTKQTNNASGQLSSVAQLCPTLCDCTGHSSQASLSITSFWSLFELMSIESVMPSSHLILCRPLLLLPPIPPSIRVFPSESTLCLRWPRKVAPIGPAVGSWTSDHRRSCLCISDTASRAVTGTCCALG